MTNEDAILATLVKRFITKNSQALCNSFVNEEKDVHIGIMIICYLCKRSFIKILFDLQACSVNSRIE